MQKTEITCDGCGRDLTYTGNCEDYRLALVNDRSIGFTMTFPAKALEQHIAILGKTGSGKTYAAKGIVEGILSDGGRVCIIDPTGAWHGLRSSATGKSAGFPVVIFGG